MRRLSVTSLCGVLSAALALSASNAAAQTPPDPDPVEIEGVEVIGRADAAELETQVDQFVDGVAAPIGHFSPARWHREICVGAVNFQAEAARQIVDRVSQVAAELELRPGRPGCKPHVLVFATNDGPTLSKWLVDRDWDLFVGGGSGMDRGRDALETFQSRAGPVRWWHVSVPVDADTGQRATRRPGDDVRSTAGEPVPSAANPPNVSLKHAASRLRSQFRDRLRNVVIVVDTAQLGEASFDQLKDYVAFLALTQVDPEVGSMRQDSILNVFDNPAGVQGLSRWDRAYLKALYDAELDAVSQNANLGEIERLMQRTLAD